MTIDLNGLLFSVILNGKEQDAVARCYQEAPGTRFYHVSICNGQNLHIQWNLDENGVPQWFDKYSLKRSVLTDTVGAALEQHF